MSNLSRSIPRDAAAARLFAHSDDLREQSALIIQFGEGLRKKLDALIRQSETACQHGSDAIRLAPIQVQRMLTEELPELLAVELSQN